MLKFLNTNCITVRDFIFGNSNKAETLIYLIVKWLLWSTIFHGSNLSINKIISEVKVRINIDKNNLSDQIFNAKWNQYTHILETVYLDNF